MKKDEIWEQIKNDKETVYGKSMLEMFLVSNEDLAIKHFMEALDMGFGKVINQKTAIKALEKLSWLPPPEVDSTYEKLIDKILERMELGSRLIFRILKDAEDMGKIILKLGEKIQKMNDDDVFSLAYVRMSDISKIAGLFGERLKKLPPKEMMFLLKEVSNLQEMKDLVEGMGGWDHVLGKLLLEGKAPKCGIHKWSELSWVLHQYQLTDYFTGKMLALKDKHPSAGIMAEFLKVVGKPGAWDSLKRGDSPLVDEVREILGEK